MLEGFLCNITSPTFQAQCQVLYALNTLFSAVSPLLFGTKYCGSGGALRARAVVFCSVMLFIGESRRSCFQLPASRRSATTLRPVQSLLETTNDVPSSLPSRSYYSTSRPLLLRRPQYLVVQGRLDGTLLVGTKQETGWDVGSRGTSRILDETSMQLQLHVAVIQGKATGTDLGTQHTAWAELRYVFP